ncbi:MAG: hypothetical protein JW822_06230 [Spirochaetales bacterium]|nr:hypothetical protein [Spirochaetales bacterium]
MNILSRAGAASLKAIPQYRGNAGWKPTPRYHGDAGGRGAAGWACRLPGSSEER